MDGPSPLLMPPPCRKKSNEMMNLWRNRRVTMINSAVSHRLIALSTGVAGNGWAQTGSGDGICGLMHPNISSGCLNQACKCFFFLTRKVNPALITDTVNSPTTLPSRKKSSVFSCSTSAQNTFARGASWFLRLAIFQLFNLPISAWSRRCPWERALPRSRAEHESSPRGEGDCQSFTQVGKNRRCVCKAFPPKLLKE